MFRLPIICCNGIGDSLLLVGRVPIHLLGALGFRFRIFYVTSQHPAQKILVPFFEEIRYCRYDARAPTRLERFIFQKMISLCQRVQRIWPPPRVSNSTSDSTRREGDVARVVSDAVKPEVRILMQTHLDGHHGWKGATAKIWGVDNWIVLIKELHALNCEVSVMEWDALALDEMKRECPYIKDAGRGSLWDMYSVMKDFDCIVSIDSWVKYAAAWCEVPQVVLVIDLRQGYTPGFESIDASWIAGWFFHGLLNRPEVQVIGLEKINGKFEYTLPVMSALKPVQVLRKIKLQLANRHKVSFIE